MRLITWNCLGGFHNKHRFISVLKPDVLVVPECGRMTGLDGELYGPAIRSFHWFGSDAKKGLAVVSYGEYSLEVHPDYDKQHKWIVPLNVTGPTPFLLFAVWTLPEPESGLYVPPLFAALEYYRHLMTKSEVVWAGDFNASDRFDHPHPSREHKFKYFVELLNDLEIYSVYHQQYPCESGEEPHHTFYRYKHADKGYHIDYVFASEGLRHNGCKVELGTHAEWSEHSDHMPLICDFG